MACPRFSISPSSHIVDTWRVWLMEVLHVFSQEEQSWGEDCSRAVTVSMTKYLKVTQPASLVAPNERERERFHSQRPWSRLTCLSQACPCWLLLSLSLLERRKSVGSVHVSGLEICRDISLGLLEKLFFRSVYLLLKNYTGSSAGCLLQALSSSSNITVC